MLRDDRCWLITAAQARLLTHTSRAHFSSPQKARIYAYRAYIFICARAYSLGNFSPQVIRSHDDTPPPASRAPFSCHYGHFHIRNYAIF